MTKETHKKGFPTLAVLILVLAVLWALSETGLITSSIPWIPIIVIVIAVGWIISHYTKR